jgi:hypothetical protein
LRATTTRSIWTRSDRGTIFRVPCFFAGKLVFTDELDGYVSRFLHNHTALELQNWLQVHGLSLVVLPVRVGQAQARAASIKAAAGAPAPTLA